MNKILWAVAIIAVVLLGVTLTLQQGEINHVQAEVNQLEKAVASSPRVARSDWSKLVAVHPKEAQHGQ